MSTIDQPYIEEFGQEKKMPVFLKVLCILTFVSCGIAFLSAIYGLTAGGDFEKTRQQLEMSANSGTPIDGMINGLEKNMDRLQEWTKINQFLSLGNVALCLTGALLMWKLRKAGYFIYIVGQILPVIALVGIYGVVKDIPYMGVGTIIMGVIGEIFAIAFIIMYGLNLKHMR